MCVKGTVVLEQPCVMYGTIHTDTHRTALRDVWHVSMGFGYSWVSSQGVLLVAAPVTETIGIRVSASVILGVESG